MAGPITGDEAIHTDTSRSKTPRGCKFLPRPSTFHHRHCLRGGKLGFDMYRPSTTLEWTFLGVVVAQAGLITALQGTILSKYLDWINPQVYQVPVSYIVPTAFAVSALGCFFQIVVALDSCRIKNNVQLWAQCLINACLSITMGLQYKQFKETSDILVDGHDMYNNPFVKDGETFWKWAHPTLIACIIVSAACSISICLVAYRLHFEFAWSLYEHISSNRQMKSRHLRYQLYLVFLKITVFLVIIFIIFYDFVLVHYVEPEFGLTIAIIPAAIIHAILAAYCVKRELKIAMIFIFVIHFGVIAYLGSRLYLLYGPTVISKTYMKEQMLMFASLALIFAIMSVITAAICVSNFNKGLKPLLMGQGRQNGPENELEMDNPQFLGMRGSQGPRRFDIE